MYQYSDFTINVTFIPYLIYDGNKAIKLTKKSKFSDFIIKKKLSKIKNITKSILNYNYKIKKYLFDKSTFLIQIEMTVLNASKHTKKYSKEYLIKKFTDDIEGYFGYIGDKGHLFGDWGPDTWMSGNIGLIKNNEYDDKMYEFGISTKKIQFKFLKIRPSPSVSATNFNIGKKKKGNDGNMWIVVYNKNKVKRWKKILKG